MNVSAKTLVGALLAAVLPFAATVSHAQDDLTITCARPQLPSQQAVGTLLGLDNFGQVYAARDRLMQDIHRACGKGARQVILSSNASTVRPTGWSQVESRFAKVSSTTSTRPAH